MAKVAFLGIGAMGQGMARRLLGAGHDVAIYNRTRARAEELAGAGARVCGTAHEAAEGAEAVFAMVGNDEASQAVWSGVNGALAGDLAQGALIIECSTLSHDWVLTLAGAARADGYRYIDCPVTGLTDVAAAGELTLLVGAEVADLEVARPLLDAIAEKIIRFGPVGAGTAYKLMINLMGSVQIAAAAEGLLIAEKAGLDLAQVADVLVTGMAASPQVVRNVRQMMAGSHERDIVFSARWRAKDTGYGVALAEKLGLNARLGRAAEDTFQTALDQGFADLNESKIIDTLRDEE